jgi:ubiquitin-like modifier-activating enzyme ATG7
VSSLAPLLSPAEVARRGVVLNLELMKWRVLPALALPRLAAARCLLVGAGTLGCHVARLMLAWGHTHLTMLDAGAVAASNPVRQNLYTVADVGKHKADAACDALRRIHPAVTATPAVMHIPMPGHHPNPSAPALAALAAAVARLAALVADHDVVFLLTDSRESRWLPALLAAAYAVPTYTAALGFDTFLVMRHGTPHVGANTTKHPCTPCPGLPPLPPPPPAPVDSCYFCIDITAPGDSLRGRSLDQQCTVTRPGLAASAAAVAVEVHVAAMHAASKQQDNADAETETETDGEGSAHTDTDADDCGGLGQVPQQVRGAYYDHSQVCMRGTAMPNCCCCGGPVQRLLRAEGAGFMLRALTEPGYLEEASGLAGMVEGAEDGGWDEDDF